MKKLFCYPRKYIQVKESVKYPGRYDLDGSIIMEYKKIETLKVPLGIISQSYSVGNNNLNLLENSPIEVKGNFYCNNNKLTTLIGAPQKVGGYFECENNQLTTLDYLPKYIGRDLYCQGNPFQNLNGLKGVKIKGVIYFYHHTEKELDCWIKALYNTDLDALEYHYNNHSYRFWEGKLVNYVMNELEDIIKIKRIKKDLNI